MTRQEDPVPYASGYSLHLYCDQVACPRYASGRSNPGEFGGRSLAEALRKAKKRGWRVHGDRTATCPACLRP